MDASFENFTDIQKCMVKEGESDRAIYGHMAAFEVFKGMQKTKTESYQIVIPFKLNTKYFRVVCTIMKTCSLFLFSGKKELIGAKPHT